MSDLRFVEAISSGEMDIARVLFRELEAQIDHDLCFQKFIEELEGLPGRYGRNEGGFLLLAFRGESVCGCVALRALSSNECEMKRLFVRSSARGLGLGRNLAVECISRARSLGYELLKLDTLEKLTEANSLYEKLGFRKTEAYCYNPLPGVVFWEIDL